MAEAADQTQHEFWRAPLPASDVVAPRDRRATCRCGTEFIVSSLYCHACGVGRPEINAARTIEIPGLAELASLDWQAIQFWRVEWLLAAVAAFAAGCLLKK